MSLNLIGVGRFAVLADWNSRTSTSEGVRIRALQISETPMVIGQDHYLGGWSWWQFDCDAMTADRLDFASLKSDLSQGPITPISSPAYRISPGGDAAELHAFACQDTAPAPDATHLEDAIALAIKAMAD